jgi:hyperosmotically inducible protein
MTAHHRIRTAFLATSITALATLGACSKSAETDATPPLSSPMTLGTQVDDTVITSSVKSVLVADDLVKSLDLQVETRKGVVQLSGFVDSQAQIDQASQLASAAEGARSVKNELMIKQ